ncbi:hypothetical protein [Engelhardtia mirabilis]|uniref:Chromosome partition protein Smc n=1 Tax=Engelhardtia mirabilis TaxID=2528011 RepID=A0A518BEW0_9BACT|nr:hypothetical protein Pla133_04880 [Planctomycetes bacterium Pla133]QDU99749.1 hypothetical protein Pla86_04880 [Planctomycetes bacterium Pla86]
MSPLRDVLARLAKSLAGQSHAQSGEELEPLPEGLVELDPETDEFADFLESIGATDADEDATLRLKDAQIGELRSNLTKMRTVADTLADTQQARLAAEARVRELESQLAAPGADLDPEEALTVAALTKRVERLEQSLEKERQRYEKLHQRLETAREKVAERHRVAAERWHELRRVGRERRILEDRVRLQGDKLDEIRGLLPSLLNARGSAAKGAAKRMGELMGESDDPNDGVSRHESSSNIDALAKTKFFPLDEDDDGDRPA